MTWCHYCGKFSEHTTREHFCIQCCVRKARRQFCSDRCRYRHRYLKHYSKRRLAIVRRYYQKHPNHTHQCRWPKCGKLFVSRLSVHKYCSNRCSNLAAVKRYCDKYRRKTPIPFTCPCGKHVVPKDALLRKYCSKRCGYKFNTRRFKMNKPHVVKQINSRSGKRRRKLLADSYVKRLLKQYRIPVTVENIEVARQRVQRHRIVLSAKRSQRVFSILGAIGEIQRGSRKQN